MKIVSNCTRLHEWCVSLTARDFIGLLIYYDLEIYEHAGINLHGSAKQELYVMVQIRTIAFSIVLRQYAFPTLKRLCFQTENLSTDGSRFMK